MPSNSDLVEEADTDSLFNELSPTDGYFNQGPAHSQDILVPDPSQDTSQSSKTREAQEERELNTFVPSFEVRRASAADQRFLPGRRRLDPDFQEETCSKPTPLTLLAPPTYSVATAGSQYQPAGLSNQRSTENTGNRYNTMGHLAIFATNDQPTDLGGTTQTTPLLGADITGAPPWRQKARSYLPINIKRFFKVLLILVVVLTGVGFIANIFLGTRNHYSNPVHTSPGLGSDDLPSKGPHSCPSGRRTSREVYAFKDPSEFTFAQQVSKVIFVQSDTYRRVHTSGELHVRPATGDFEVSIRLDVEMHYSDFGTMKEISFEQKAQRFSIYTPSHVIVAPGIASDPCLFVVATVHIRAGTHLDFLGLETKSMSVFVHGGLDLNTNAVDVHVAGGGSVEFPHGHGTLANIDPRKIVITTISGSISGTFPLFDLLRIGSQSGSIQIDVEPREALVGNPQPAQLLVETVSGTIQVGTTVLKSHQGISTGLIPARDYQNNLRSVSGDLRATLLHGSELRLISVSGTITAQLSPYGPVEERSYITASTSSGSTDITVLSSLLHPGKPLRKLYSDYYYRSGSLQIRYPEEWEGRVKGTTLTGSITVDWPGMRITRASERYGAGHSLNGYKGDGEGTLIFEGISGSTTLHG